MTLHSFMFFEYFEIFLGIKGSQTSLKVTFVKISFCQKHSIELIFWDIFNLALTEMCCLIDK